MKTQALTRIISMAFGILLILGCSPQKRLHRLIKAHPELSVKDSVVLRDTLITKETILDTFVLEKWLTEPLLFEKDKLEIELVKIYDTIQIKGTCRKDTLVIEKSVPIDRIQYIKSETSHEKWWDEVTVWLGLVLAIVFLVLVARVMKLFGD